MQNATLLGLFIPRTADQPVSVTDTGQVINSSGDVLAPVRGLDMTIRIAATTSATTLRALRDAGWAVRS